MKSNFWKVWGLPVIIGILSAIGLLSALTGDGFYDLLSWLTLGIPVILTIRYLMTAKNLPINRKIRSR
ncbi:hypothetical protein DYBT9623_04129 [Dyadobacter sp. CECT 9623]|uniref:DUF4175 domain-containing protein n=1 Tax=Dyadobacter linearis TaxID=2823330 RepID=A0ABM8UV53_9BACT|nr:MULTISPECIES: hypothetical protein [unclassified Dyadobacter]MCE7059528.1 hypothetical protein [Dyadobacter sp. CY343]CAG5072364.1 hypothetical protein DYBT9623_04129 [Dyadobacter sp. CECT 9623]